MNKDEINPGDVICISTSRTISRDDLLSDDDYKKFTDFQNSTANIQNGYSDGSIQELHNIIVTLKTGRNFILVVPPNFQQHSTLNGLCLLLKFFASLVEKPFSELDMINIDPYSFIKWDELDVYKKHRLSSKLCVILRWFEVYVNRSHVANQSKITIHMKHLLTYIGTDYVSCTNLGYCTTMIPNPIPDLDGFIEYFTTSVTDEKKIKQLFVFHPDLIKEKNGENATFDKPHTTFVIPHNFDIKKITNNQNIINEFETLVEDLKNKLKNNELKLFDTDFLISDDNNYIQIIVVLAPIFIENQSHADVIAIRDKIRDFYELIIDVIHESTSKIHIVPISSETPNIRTLLYYDFYKLVKEVLGTKQVNAPNAKLTLFPANAVLEGKKDVVGDPSSPHRRRDVVGHPSSPPKNVVPHPPHSSFLKPPVKQFPSDVMKVT